MYFVILLYVYYVCQMRVELLKKLDDLLLESNKILSEIVQLRAEIESGLGDQADAKQKLGNSESFNEVKDSIDCCFEPCEKNSFSVSEVNKYIFSYRISLSFKVRGHDF